MATLRSIVFSSVIAGIVVGLLVTFAHQLGTVPLILKAETYEQSEATAPAAPAAHTHDAAAPVHEHDEDAWMPADGMQRNLFTALGDVVTAIGFALLLSSAYVLTGRRVTWREGLFWGLAGFAVFTLAPGLGLPPELPGMPAAPLETRQAWWIMTAAATAMGLYLIAIRRVPITILGGLVLVVAPHLAGAPETDHAASALPAGYAAQFAARSLGVSFVFWIVIGLAFAWAWQTFGRTQAVVARA